MRKIEHEYADYYYLTSDGRVYNARFKRYIAPDEHKFKLRTKDGARKKVTLKTLYKLVYHKNFCLDNIQNLEGEEWRTIRNTDDKYLVSNIGRVKSLAGYEAKIMRARINDKGYQKIELPIAGTPKNKSIHCLVAAAFLPPPESAELYHVHHKDFNKLNNAADNLELLTPAAHREKHRKEHTNATSTESAKNSD